MTTAPLAVGVDAANLLRDRRGIGRYVSTMLQAWRTNFADRIEPTLLVAHPFPRTLEAAFAARLGMAGFRLARRAQARGLGLRVVWYPWNGMTWQTPLPSVVTVHDLWPFVEPARDAGRRRREQSHYLAAARRAARFIAVSRFTAEQLASFLQVPRERIDVIPHGVDALVPGTAAPARFADASAYVLFVGEAEPRKDLDVLVEAMRRLPMPLAQVTALVIAGKKRAAAMPAPDGPRIEWMGEVSDARLASLYAGAAAFVLPSRYEGFGLPVLEAMRYGVPVIASDAAAIPEAGGDAALYFHPGDAQRLAELLAGVLTDRELAVRLSEASRRRVAAMKPARSAERTIEVLERAAAA
jgi:glycosyltransferase involved in cell wall biosynthesis